MPLPVWPGTLPQYVLREGYGSEGFDPNLRTGMEDGQPYVRTKELASWTTVNVKILLRTTSQVADLKNFWLVTLNRGTSQFTMPVYSFEGGYVSKTCIWDGPFPALTPFGGSNLPVASFKVKVRDF